MMELGSRNLHLFTTEGVVFIIRYFCWINFFCYLQTHTGDIIIIIIIIITFIIIIYF